MMVNVNGEIRYMRPYHDEHPPVFKITRTKLTVIVVPITATLLESPSSLSG